MGKLKSLLVFAPGQKVTEKQMLAMVALYVCGMVMCMACLASTTWAWFSLTLESRDNVIQMGTTSVETFLDGEPMELVDYELVPGEYVLTLKNTGETTAHGLVTLGGNDPFATEAMRAGSDDVAEVKLTVYEATTLTVQPRWGIAAETAQTVTVGEKPTEPVTPETDPQDEDQQIEGETATDPTDPTEQATEEPTTEPTTAPTEEPTIVPTEDQP